MFLNQKWDGRREYISQSRIRNKLYIYVFKFFIWKVTAIYYVQLDVRKRLNLNIIATVSYRKM